MTPGPQLEAAIDVHAYYLGIPHELGVRSCAIGAWGTKNVHEAPTISHVVNVDATIIATNAEQVFVGVAKRNIACCCSMGDDTATDCAVAAAFPQTDRAIITGRRDESLIATAAGNAPNFLSTMFFPLQNCLLFREIPNCECAVIVPSHNVASARNPSYGTEPRWRHQTNRVGSDLQRSLVPVTMWTITSYA
eukprot:scaffold30_cov416-Prasinococcus_capsulatus_cf.AAC.40